MKKINFLTVSFLLLATSIFAQTKWNFDNSHTKIGFSVSHMVITDVEGNFKSFSGTIETDEDDFEGAKIEFSADVNSIFTDNEKRDAHLKSADFFDAANHPKVTFVGKSFTKIDDNNYKLVGDFTMRGVTKEIELAVKFRGIVTDPWGNTRAGFKLSGEVNRFDYGLEWNKTLEAGGLIVSKEVRLNIDVELIKVK